MESERDAWGLSSADWCHVAINFKRSARIVQTSFSVLLFLKKKKKRRRTRAISPCPPPSLHSPFPIYLLSNPPWITGVYFITEGNEETRDDQRARIFLNLWSFVIFKERKSDKWIFLFIFFLKRRNKDVNVSSRLVNIIKYW